MKLIKTQDAVGHVLAHDMTRIIPGVEKGPVFRKGHVVKAEDIPVLLSIGKENLYIYEKEEGMLHENEGAAILYDLCAGSNVYGTDVSEGKIEIKASIDGLLKIDRKSLMAVNSLGDMMIASRHGDFPVSKDSKLAGTRVIPLVIAKERMDLAARLVREDKIFNVMPFKKKKAGIVTTGSEVFHGRIEDRFTPVVIEKIRQYGGRLIGHSVCDDDPDRITGAIMDLLGKGAEIVLCTGGMSVDPDDRTPLAIKNTGAEIISYGAPVLPGAMFLLAYYGEKRVPIVGLPGCVMYARRTIFDLILPRLMADDPVTAEDLQSLGEGGLCLGCDECTFPDCSFGKGGWSDR